MITFETQEEFEEAVVDAIMNKLRIQVECRGEPFMTGVKVAITNNKHEVLLYDRDGVA